jgi:hypothetical protein
LIDAAALRLLFVRSKLVVVFCCDNNSQIDDSTQRIDNNSDTYMYLPTIDGSVSDESAGVVPRRLNNTATTMPINTNNRQPPALANTAMRTVDDDSD